MPNSDNAPIPATEQRGVKSSQQNDDQNTRSKPRRDRWTLLHYNQKLIKVFNDTILRTKSFKKDPPLEGKSLWIFSPTNGLRKLCSIVTNHNAFGIFIMVCIIISTLTLALEEPLEDPKSNKLKVINNIDKVTTTIFTIEAVLKIIAHGFILNGKKSYLRNSWNILDFIIVVSALLSLTSDSDIGFFKVFEQTPQCFSIDSILFDCFPLSG